jgi:hypothetical protein
MADYQPPAGYEEVVPGYHDFKAKGNEVVEGVLMEKEEGLGENNSSRYTLERKDNHEQIMFWGSMVLDGRMKPIKVGEEIVVWYQGEKPSPKRKGKFFHDWRVYRNKDSVVKQATTAADLEEVFGK